MEPTEKPFDELARFRASRQQQYEQQRALRNPRVRTDVTGKSNPLAWTKPEQPKAEPERGPELYPAPAKNAEPEPPDFDALTNVTPMEDWLAVLYELLAQPVLISTPLGKKRPIRQNWQKTTFADTKQPAHQKELRRTVERGGNIGVKLGPDSGRLFTLDVDSDELTERWKQQAPWLTNTLITRGARGCQFWLRLEPECDYPKEGIFHVKLDGVKTAELRFGGGGNGAQSIIFGLHPSGCQYQILNRTAPLTVSLSDLDELGYRPEQPAERGPERTTAPDPAGSLEKRILAYLERCDPSIAGQCGDDALFKTACKLVIGWDLSADEALPYLRHYNATKCEPPWPYERLKYKLEQASKEPGERGALRETNEQYTQRRREENRQASFRGEKAGKAPSQEAAAAAAKTLKEKADDFLNDDEDREAEYLAELRSKFQNALLNFGEFQKLDIPQRQSLMGNWFKEGDTGFIYGQRGAGKTWTADIIVSHLTRGVDIDEDWNTPSKIHVVLVDGEMAADDARARLAGLSADREFLHVLHHEVLFERTGMVINLANPDQQKIVTALCEQTGAKVLVLETLSSLFRGLREKENDDWERVNPWILDLRRRHIAVIIVAHAGWDGEHQRGGSRREDDATWVIRVAEITERAPDERGARFTTEFTKWRNVDSPPLLRQWSAKTETNGIVSCWCEELSFDAQVLAKIVAGLDTATAIAEELKVNKSRVSRGSDRLAEKKLIEKCGKGNRITYKPRGFMRNENDQ